MDGAGEESAKERPKLAAVKAVADEPPPDDAADSSDSDDSAEASESEDGGKKKLPSYLRVIK